MSTRAGDQDMVARFLDSSWAPPLTIVSLALLLLFGHC